MKKIPLYKIIFADGSKFEGGNIKETKWLNIPNNKKIQNLFFRLPSDDYLTLSGYESYYHFVEATKDVSPVNKNSREKIESINLLGKKKGLVFWYKIDLNNKIGSIEFKIKKEKDKTIQALNPQGWKKGAKNNS